MTSKTEELANGNDDDIFMLTKKAYDRRILDMSNAMEECRGSLKAFDGRPVKGDDRLSDIDFYKILKEINEGNLPDFDDFVDKSVGKNVVNKLIAFRARLIDLENKGLIRYIDYSGMLGSLYCAYPDPGDAGDAIVEILETLEKYNKDVTDGKNEDHDGHRTVESAAPLPAGGSL